MKDNKFWTIFLFIVVIAVFSFLVDIPRLPAWVPAYQWFNKQKIHLGLDLQGGTQLIYQTDTSQIPTEQKASAIQGARDVIERRVNVFGVAEPLFKLPRAAKSGKLLWNCRALKMSKRPLR